MWVACAEEKVSRFAKRIRVSPLKFALERRDGQHRPGKAQEKWLPQHRHLVL